MCLPPTGRIPTSCDAQTAICWWTRRAICDASGASSRKRGASALILLTYRDDVADAHRYASDFGARGWIHEYDADAAPWASDFLHGPDPQLLRDDLQAIPVPGHTKGSVAYLVAGRYLFTGDSLAWSFERDDLYAFREACWFSWSEQADSLERLAAHPFEWVLAGHGGSQHRPATEMRERLLGLVDRMRVESP